VTALPSLVKVDTISDIYINPNFDSVLEQRFIECLKKMSGVAGLPVIKLVQDVVHGKSGFVLEVGGQRYRVEPQSQLNADAGVAVPSTPDFVIWPWASGSKRRPVAVFCDGWAYHKHCLREDAAKRSAIVASGRFWVWSVTHQDVAAALDGRGDSDLDPSPVALGRHDGSKAPAGAPRAAEKAFNQHAVPRLLHWLGTAPGMGAQDAAVEQQQRNGSWLQFLMVPVTAADKATAEAERGPWLPQLPLHIREPGSGFAPAVSKAGGALRVMGWWPTLLAKGLPTQPDWSAPGAVLLDPAAAQDEDGLHRQWRSWLQLFNTLQSMPGTCLVTADGLQAHDYDGLVGSAGAQTVARAAPQAALNAVWHAVIEQALEALRPGLKQLAQADAEPPEVGLELADAKGRVVADCELAWGAKRVVVLRADQADMAELWSADNWRTVLVDDDGVLAAGAPWAVATAAALGLDIENTNEGGAT